MIPDAIFLPFRQQKIAISLYEKRASPTTVLFLFGGSTHIGRERFFGWQRALFDHGISSVSFDYLGTGQSSGTFSDSSLVQRIEEANIVIKWIKRTVTSTANIAICGGSMGAYVALGLASRFRSDITHLILFCPAAYAKEAHTVGFGTPFTSTISQPGSWRNSFAFDWLEEFGGRLLFIIPEHDEVVPEAITLEFFRRARRASSVKRVIIEHSSHRLLAHGKSNEAVRREVYRQSVLFLNHS